MESKPSRLLRLGVQYGLGVGVGYCFGYMLADTFPYGAYRVEGESMYPTLEKNDWVLTSSRRNGLHRGDVVVLRSVKEPKERMIKRVTGLPDDLIHTDDAKLVRVPRGYCWIEGDNASVSLDSNVFGAVPVGLVESRALYRLDRGWRLHKLESVPRERLQRTTKKEREVR